MEYLVQFFAWLMEWCHSWCPNWWADIVIFTFLTKVLQFPVSLWCQVNSLKMVSLMPASNRIAMEHYGDKDAIGEETAALYKREHYHPLVSLVPLAINIVILMAFVKVIYGIGDTLIAQTSQTSHTLIKPLIARVPWTDGGLAWMMPIGAALAAWFLGWCQNRINPLQREQSRAQQVSTNVTSICISLFLGCFVAAGVGLYWAASNLFSIVVQFMENVCIPPAKHIDYRELRRSQAELARFRRSLASKAEVSPEDRRREKADYRKFFGIVNKHLVFFSEGCGYYKYFKSVIEWLIANSDITIHYVTNDPGDGVFQPSTFNLSPDEYAKRIRPYYIGPRRIIPLMMKMDADMVVMTTPDLNTYHLKRSYVRKDVEYVYLDHGPTSVHMCYRKGAFDHFDTIMCNGPFQVVEHRATEKLYNLKPKKLVESGYPLLDTLKIANSAVDLDLQPRPDSPRIMIANSHQSDNIFDSCLDEVIAAIQSVAPAATIVIRPHPQYVRRYPARWQSIKTSHTSPALIFEDDFSKPSTMDLSDVLVTDWSGIAYEFAYKTRRPTLFVDTLMKVVNPEWQKLGITPTDIWFRDEVGVAVAPERPAMEKALAGMLRSPDTFAARIARLFAENFFNPGKAGEAVGNYILDTLIEKENRS